MSLTNPSYKVNTTFSAKNISSAASVYQYTADGDYKLIIEVYLDSVAGGGDYIGYLTKQLAGAGSAYPILPKTTATAAAGETAFGLWTMSCHVKSGDVVNVMIDGLAGDTSIGGKIRIIADNYSLVETSDIAPAVLDAVAASYDDPNSIGEAINNAGSAADPLVNAVPGSYASGSAGHALGRIGSGQITTTCIVAQSGAVTTWQGDDYDADEGRSLDWTDSDNEWPVLTGASIAVIIDEIEEYVGSVVTATGDSKKVRLELTAVQTAAIAEGAHVFQVIATLQTTSRKVTLVEGAWISKRRFAE